MSESKYGSSFVLPATESMSSQKSASESASLLLMMISGESGVRERGQEAEQHEQGEEKDDVRDCRAGFESVREGGG